MPNNIDRNEFEQYERRIDEKFETLNDKINNLPNIIIFFFFYFFLL